MNDLEHTDRYLRPGWFTKHVFNRLVRGLARLGISVRGSSELGIRGRSSGEWRTTAVNVLDLDETDYLVAPRGTTHWVQNLRAAGRGELRVGRRVRQFEAVELNDEAKTPVLRAYLLRWRTEVGRFFPGIGPNASDGDIAKIAAGFPVFAIADQSQP